jgi:hypothetical protein
MIANRPDYAFVNSDCSIAINNFPTGSQRMAMLRVSEAYAHSWVKQLDIEHQPEDKSITTRLSTECVRVFKAVLNYIRSSRHKKIVKRPVQRSLRQSCECFILWLDGHRVAEGGIDEALTKSRTLRRSIIGLLISIGRILTDSMPSTPISSSL